MPTEQISLETRASRIAIWLFLPLIGGGGVVASAVDYGLKNPNLATPWAYLLSSGLIKMAVMALASYYLPSFAQSDKKSWPRLISAFLLFIAVIGAEIFVSDAVERAIFGRGLGDSSLPELFGLAIGVVLRRHEDALKKSERS